MLDLARLRQIRLTTRPGYQQAVGWILSANYGLGGVKVEIEGLDRLPREPALLAMNHTDRYNYWPFQHALWRKADRFTATWVKGKYYQNAAVGKFMELTNNIPTVSRGYLISRDFVNTLRRAPTTEEYEALRHLVSAAALEAPPPGSLERVPELVPRALLETPRDMLGRAFDPKRESYEGAVDALFRAMMRRFVELNAEAFDKDLHVLVFPQGTRSRRLSRGHGGLSQIALRFRKAIVPIGCSGSDGVYPGSSPIARKGRIVYRIGEPLTYAQMAQFHVPGDFEPFTAEAERDHAARFQGLVDVVMDRIEPLLDPPYRYSEDRSSEGVRGASRFV